MVLPYEGWFSLFIEPFLVFLVFALPTLVGLGGKITLSILSNRLYKERAKTRSLLDELRAELSASKDDSKKADIRDQIKTLQYQYDKLSDRYLHNFNYDESVWDALCWGVLDDGWLEFLTFVSWILKIVAIVALIVSFRFPISCKNDYKRAINRSENIETLIASWEDESHPTKAYIEKAEKWNSDQKHMAYLSKEFLEDESHFIDTELLWARFCDNVSAKRVVDIIK